MAWMPAYIAFSNLRSMISMLSPLPPSPYTIHIAQATKIKIPPTHYVLESYEANKQGVYGTAWDPPAAVPPGSPHAGRWGLTAASGIPLIIYHNLL
jgi:hypothetical protein